MSFLSKLLAGSVLLSSIAWGQTQTGPVDQPDPEDRNHGVARISLLNGDVSVRRGDSGDLVAASLNAPMLVQDSIQTGQASRAEVQFDSSNRLRLADNVELRMAELVAGRYQVQIARGTTTLSILRDSNAQIELDTPSVAVRPSRAGEYRVAVLEDGTTQITVRSGEARVDSSRGQERLMAGQTMLARGSAENPEFQIVAAIGGDEWDAFNERRDRELDHSESYQYVSRDIAGAEDLDGNGQWNNDPTYGQVWTPRVAPGWAPYRSGRWVWEDYYGWTWVSYDPWGWAPYHYGNWFVGARGWSWYPGPRSARYWYRPAIVSFFGFGAGAGVGFGFGNIGWIALAPFELFHAWYGRGFGPGYRGFGGGVNSNVFNNYRNARVANGVTAMNSRDFANGQFGRFSSVGANELRGASALRGPLPVTPGSGSLRFNDRQTAAVGRNSFAQTRFAMHNQPMQTNRSSFGQQSTPSAPSGPARQGAGPGQANSAWQRFGSPTRASSPVGGSSFASSPANSAGRSFAQANPQSGASGWDRFGSPANRSVQSGTAGRSFSQAAPQYGSSSARSVQVAPPMVRERQSQSYSQPSRSQPSYSQPSSRQSSAPASHGSSGGGGSSRGGGSSSHSSGGSGSSSHHGR